MPQLSQDEITRVARLADCDRRTVQDYLAQRRVTRPSVARQIAHALIAIGRQDAIPRSRKAAES